MNEINIKTLNLNLIRALDTLLDEGNVSKAADKLYISQSAASHALNKLRDIFKDEILLRTSKGMELTDKALLLKPEVKRAMEEIDKLFSREMPFDPKTTPYKFKLGFVGDFGDLVILPKLMRWIDQHNSGISIDVRHLCESSIVHELEEGNLDLTVGHIHKLPKSIVAKTLLTTSFSCVVRHDHPLSKVKKPSKKHYMQYGHLHTRYHESSDLSEYIEKSFAKLGVSRRIQLSTDSPLSLPEVIQNTNLIATVAEVYASMLTKHNNLHSFPCPYAQPKMSITLSQHKRTLSHGALKWLVEFIVSASEGH